MNPYILLLLAASSSSLYSGAFSTRSSRQAGRGHFDLNRRVLLHTRELAEFTEKLMRAR